MRKYKFPAACAVSLLLAACTDVSSVSQEMQYIKTSVTYATLCDMYNDPDSYLGGVYHIVGTLYPSKDDEGNPLYSVYATMPGDSDHGIGLELDWDDFSGISDYDKITVEGTLDSEKGTMDGTAVEYLILRCTMVEKREG